MRTRAPRRLARLGVAAALLAQGCGVAVTAPDLGRLYTRAAQAGDELRNPVIVIPGILGSRLEDEATGRVVWGAFGGAFADPRTPAGARLIALPMRAGAPLDALVDGVRPAGALDRIRIQWLGLAVEQQAYVHILRALGAGGYRDQDLGRMGQVDYGPGHFTCFQFAYDWRRDNAENARRLHEFILDRRAYVQAALRRRGVERPDLKFDLVAHSMGGLLARYYLRYGGAPLPDDGSPPPLTWAGARHVERAVLIGTPNGGSVQSLIELTGGTRLPFPLPSYPPAVLGTMPAIYQLLPRARHAAVVDAGGRPLDPLDPAVWERHGWGLAAAEEPAALRWLLPDAPDAAARRRVALEHLQKSLARARRFHEAIDRPAPPPPGLGVHLFAGDAAPTPAVVAVGPGGALAVTERAPGDGTVTRASAVMDERLGRAWTPVLVSPVAWRDVTFLFTDHLGLTRDPAFTDNVLFRLLESPR